MKSIDPAKGLRKSLAYFLALSQLSMMSLVPVLAADNHVRIGGSTVFTVNGATADRAIKIQKNIDNSLVASKDHSPSSIKITYVKGQPVITLGGFYVVSVDSATARAAGTTPSLLAQKWASSMKAALANKKSTDAYIAQLTGTGSDTYSSSGSNSASSVAAPSTAHKAPAQSNWQPVPSSPSSAAYDSSPANSAANQPASTIQAQPYQGRITYVPAGMVIPVRLETAISSTVAKPGDMVIAKTTESIDLGNGSLPAGTQLRGQITDAADGAWMGKSGRVSMKFTSIRTPNGAQTPITAHISGRVGKYEDRGSNNFHGENTNTKVKKALVSTAIGAGGGATVGIAIGAIAGGGRGVGRGVLAGAAIGAGLGLAQGLLARKGSEVNMTQGQTFNLQLDAPATVAMN